MASSATLGSLSAQSGLLEARQDLMLRQMKSGTNNDDAKIEKGAKDFEAILVGSWLQQAEQSFATVPGTDDDEDPGKGQMMSLGVQQLATKLADSGALGIGKMIAKAMHANAAKAAGQTSEPSGQGASGPEQPAGAHSQSSRQGMQAGKEITKQ